MLLERLLCYITVKMRGKEGLYKRGKSQGTSVCLSKVFLIIIISASFYYNSGFFRYGKEKKKGGALRKRDEILGNPKDSLEMYSFENEQD